MRKFKVELYIEIEDEEYNSYMMEHNSCDGYYDDVNDYITQELGWASDSFEGFSVEQIKEIKDEEIE